MTMHHVNRWIRHARKEVMLELNQAKTKITRLNTMMSGKTLTKQELRSILHKVQEPKVEKPVTALTIPRTYDSDIIPKEQLRSIFD